MRQPSETKRFTLLYILGSGHCGSTLLDMLLNGHSQIAGMGELMSLRRYIVLKGTELTQRRPGDWQEVLTNVLTTKFWKQVRQCFENCCGTPFSSLVDSCSHPKFKLLIRKWTDDDIKKHVLPYYILLSCIHETTGADIITDSSKFPHRLYLLQRSGFFKVKVIHLIRDGRGVTNSYYRKYGNFKVALQRWMYPNIQSIYLRRLFSRKDWTVVRYEDLATNPEKTLIKVCSFLNTEFEPRMLSFRSTPYLGVGGNRMREEQSHEDIFLDENWKKELPWNYRLAFALTAGWLNRFYGYGVLL